MQSKERGMKNVVERLSSRTDFLWAKFLDFEERKLTEQAIELP